MDPGGSATRQDAGVEAPLQAEGGLDPALALSLTGIVKRWGKLTVLDGASLQLGAGQQVWVGGRNGVGKTTLLRIASGLILPQAGEVRLHGLDPDRQRRAFQKHLGFLSAGNAGLYARLTVRANLEFWAGIAFVPRRERAAVIDAAITRFGLDELAKRRVDRLSMGQRQRARLAGTFLHRPSVVLLDEPETSLDDDGLASLRTALADHVETGGASLICSPSHEKLQFEVDRALVLEGGKLVPA